jgi:glutamyl-tRNA synthetase
MNVRVRYAPSPTGKQHIGSVRTALFNYLFARSTGGTFILRIEDTDRERYQADALADIYETYNWLGFHWDEGPDVGGPHAPYIQSERQDIYRKYAEELIAGGHAYYCYCSSERLEEMRKEQERTKQGSGYDRRCRNLSAAEQAQYREEGIKPVIRFKIPLDGVTTFHDELLGDITKANVDINPDPVLLKSDGFPTYHLANIVDDHLMGITHVLRAQEWIPSTPLHVIMYKAFGWQHPEYCHLPMVMGQDGKKLSKRHGATSIDEFRRQGYLPEALINYVALLGASYEEGKDIYTLTELAERFSLDKLNKAPAIFDYKKLEWYNGQYIRMKTDAELGALIEPYAVNEGLFGSPGQKPTEEQRALFVAAMPLIKERLSFLHEGPAKLTYLFDEPAMPQKEEFFPKKLDLTATINLLTMVRELVPAMAKNSDEASEALVKQFAEEKKVKMGDLMMPLRVAVTGSRVSPPLFGSIRLLGEMKSLARVDRALEYLRS